MSLRIQCILSIISTFTSFLLAGCGSQYAYHQTEDEVQQFQDLSVSDFIKEKVIDSDTTPVKAILAALEPISKVVATIDRTSSLQEERESWKQNFIYRALFDYRNQALTKPKKDLELFCKAKGGHLKQMHSNNINIASENTINPLDAYLYVMRSNVKGLDAEIKITSDISIPLHFTKEQLARSYADMIAKRNQLIGLDEARKAIDKAIGEKSFGEFSCTKSDREKLWSVNIMPLALEGVEAIISDNKIYKMYIGVVPIIN